jgi:gamma-glutamylcyclotransferase (GGCT)/AIG2-like uncharacterized protein YtfP
VPLLFSHGSLQQEAVQLSVYGRVLRGEPDELVGWVSTQIAVPQWHKAAASGVSRYANVERSSDSGSRVTGTVFEVSDADLAAADAYELDAEYGRVVAVLASGRSAWVYVSQADSARS